MRVPFVDLRGQYLSIKNEIDKAIADVIAETSFVGGRYVEAFEQQFASFYGVKHVVSCGNGTDSLYIILKMLGIGVGDEVITSANSWISSAETISQTGAMPVFVDVDPTYYSMDETQLQSKITSRTKAIMPVHLQGQMCNIEIIKKLCDNNNLHLIEDCAQSHFSEYKKRRAGLFGVAASFSFYPSKNLGAYGDAGCIITNDDDLAEKCRMYANHGALKKHQHQIEGTNSRLDGLQASILSTKLPHILKWTDMRIKNAQLYNKHLEGIEGLILPAIRPSTKHTYHLYVIRTKQRTLLAEHLNKNGIETSVHYPTALPNLQAYQYLGYKPSDFPVASQLQDEILSLPIYPEMTNEMILHVTNSIKMFYKI
jgi:dTDP-4-amino-4,6-dideoxygalactose transaminase